MEFERKSSLMANREMTNAAAVLGDMCGEIRMTGASASFAQTVKVPGNYPTIQSALNAVVSGSAADGTVIEVQPGHVQRGTAGR